MKLTTLSMSTALLLSMHISAVSSPQGAPTGTSRRAAASPPTGKVAAASPTGKVAVDGHVIPMDEIVLKCVREDRDYVVDQMIQAFVIDRESKRRGIKVSEAAIDARVEEFRRAVAPSTVAVTLTEHGMSMAELRDAFRVAIERDLLTEAEVKPSRMVHCHQIRLRCTPDGVPKLVSGARYTSDEARTLLVELRDKVSKGADFDALAAEYGEPESTDLGVLYQRMLNVDAAVLDAGLALSNGSITTQAVKTSDGYSLIKAVSTSDTHPVDEDDLYRKASAEYRKTQAMFLQPEVIGSLIAKCKISFVKDSELVDGKPLPKAAAVVDGHVIPMSTVARRCVANVGHRAANIAIENYVVDKECKRRGIIVSDAEIDAQIDMLRKRIAPETIEEGLAAHHTTMAGLRSDFRQQIEREKLVIDSIKPPSMAHVQVIFLKSDDHASGGPAQPSAFVPFDDVREKLLGIRRQIDQGASFSRLAQQYSQMGNSGDVGIIFAGAKGIDTAVVETAMKMKAGEMTTEPVKTYGGYFLLRIVSTRDEHGADEETAYAAAVSSYKRQQADFLAPQAVNVLVSKAVVVNYL